MPPRKDVPQGTLDLLILRILSRAPEHGWGIMKRISDLTDQVFQATPGSLFPALQRLEANGWVKGTWATSENNRRARFYALTAAGRRQLALEEQHWKAITLAVSKVTGDA